MKINFKTCQMGDGNEWVIINDNFDRLFKQNQSQGFARFQYIINGKEGWVNSKGEPIGGLHDGIGDFVKGFATFYDNGKWGWVNRKGEPIGGLHDGTGNFKNDFAQFKDEINGEDKYGWVNLKGEPIGGLHDLTGDFVKGFAQFRDKINGEYKRGWVNRKGEQIGGLHDWTYDFENDFASFKDNGKYGCIDKYGIGYYTSIDDARKIQKLILKKFPLGSMKFYIFRKIYENRF